MKKTYIIPEALIVELSAMQMMAQSNDNPTGDVNISDNPISAGGAETKGSVNIWDEEW